MRDFDANRMRHIEHEARKLAHALDNGLRGQIGERIGFTLFLFSFSGPECTYISNASRDDMIRVVKEWLKRQESGEAPTTSEQRN